MISASWTIMKNNNNGYHGLFLTIIGVIVKWTCQPRLTTCENMSHDLDERAIIVHTVYYRQHYLSRI